jgi:hypothetical protein
VELPFLGDALSSETKINLAPGKINTILGAEKEDSEKWLKTELQHTHNDTTHQMATGKKCRDCTWVRLLGRVWLVTPPQLQHKPPGAGTKDRSTLDDATSSLIIHTKEEKPLIPWSLGCRHKLGHLWNYIDHLAYNIHSCSTLMHSKTFDEIISPRDILCKPLWKRSSPLPRHC